ncbi:MULTISPECIES: NAD-dependent epimerase/dehydratase family protein [Streptomyces]|uniref:NAD-dependent epimerase/dehydratase family protein n=1 Tax=Streptomyces TaxID=1883 RepID=UPI0016789CD0|nr:MULTISPECIES: NAD-dependent epimerase/dehydratase family protein [Streptomyces]MBD3575436.1 NAD-dependent epimerase/dehydratase family protein [Streptomyces sp. KD18]
MAAAVKILITGATGFLGGHLADACLRSGHGVRALVRPGSNTDRLRALPGVELVTGDLTRPDSLRRAADGCEAVLHSAARVVDHGTRAQFTEANVTGTLRLMDAARAAGARRFVFVSSPSALMHLREGDRLGIDETTPYPTRWFNDYCATKAVAEQHVLAADTAGFTTCALRPRGIWGPRDHAGFLPRLIGALHAGRLPDLSGGKHVLVSLCHVDNAVDACLRAAVSAPAERIGGRAYFVADAETTDLWPFLADVAARLGCPPPAPRIPLPAGRALAAAVETAWRLRPDAAARARSSPPLSRYMMALLTRSSTYDTTAARRDLGYAPVRTQEDGLRDLVRWVASQGGVASWTAPRPHPAHTHTPDATPHAPARAPHPPMPEPPAAAAPAPPPKAEHRPALPRPRSSPEADSTEQPFPHPADATDTPPVSGPAPGPVSVPAPDRTPAPSGSSRTAGDAPASRAGQASGPAPAPVGGPADARSAATGRGPRPVRGSAEQREHRDPSLRASGKPGSDGSGAPADTRPNHDPTRAEAARPGDAGRGMAPEGDTARRGSTDPAGPAGREDTSR